MNTVKHQKKWYQKTLIGLGIFVGVIGLLLGGINLYFRAPVSNYYSISTSNFLIPDLNNNFVPQGIAYDKKTDAFFLTGYSKKNDNSPIYIVDNQTGDAKKVLLETSDGEKFTYHCGGISLYRDYIYIAASSDTGLYVFSYSEAVKAENGASIKSIGKFDVKITEDDSMSVAFTTVNNGTITVGEFYNEKSYPTLASHKFTTNHEQYNQALAITYRFDLTSPLGINPEPVEAYSIPDQIQGMAFDDEYMYLSSSWGASFSHIYKHDLSKIENLQKININNYEVNLFAIENYNLAYDLKAAPMCEEIELHDGKLYTMNESASNTYIFGKLTFSYWCLASDTSKMND